MFLADRATPQVARAERQLTRYDQSSDELMVLESGTWIFATESKDPPRTKKADIEKGEDQKDRWG